MEYRFFFMELEAGRVNTIQYNTDNFYNVCILGVVKFEVASSQKAYDRKHMTRASHIRLQEIGKSTN